MSVMGLVEDYQMFAIVAALFVGIALGFALATAPHYLYGLECDIRGCYAWKQPGAQYCSGHRDERYGEDP